MLPPLEAKQRLPAVGEHLGDGAIEVAKECVGPFRRIVTGARAEDHDVGVEPPAGAATDRRRMRRDQTVGPRRADQAVDDVSDLLGLRQRAVEIQLAKVPTEGTAGAAAQQIGFVGEFHVLTPRRIHHQRRCASHPVLGDRPRRLDRRPHAPGQCLDHRPVEGVGLDRKALSERVEKSARSDTALLGTGRGERLGVREFGIVRAHVVQRHVVRVEQTQLFQVRVGEPPAAPLIDPEAMGKAFANGSLGIHPPGPLDVRFLHPLISALDVIREEPEGRLDRETHLVVGEALRICCVERGKDRAPKQRHEDKIVEVAGLQRRILAVVGEREELALFRSEGRCADVVHPP